MSRRLSLVFVLMLSMICVLGSCALGAQAGEIVLQVAGSTGGAATAYVGAIDMFNKEYAGKYRAEFTAITMDELQNKLMMQFIAGKPTYDVFAVHANWQKAFHPYVEVLDPYIEEYGVDVRGRFGAGIDNCIINGDTIGFPVRQSALMFFYRKDIFEEEGLELPETLEELLEISRRLAKDTNGDGKIDVYSQGLQLNSPYWTTWEYAQHAFPLGVRYLTEDLSAASKSLLEEPAREVLRYMKALMDEDLSPDPLAWTYHDSIAGFQTGRLVFDVEDSMRAAFIEDPSQSVAAGKMGYAPLPLAQLGSEKPIYLGGFWSCAIDKNTTKKEAAFALLEFMTRPEVQKNMAVECGNGPSVLSVYDEPEFLAVCPAGGVMKEILARPASWHALPFRDCCPRSRFTTKSKPTCSDDKTKKPL